MSFKFRGGAPYLAIFALAFLAGWPALRAGFVFDDTAQVLQNPAVRDFDLNAIFTRGYWANASEAAESIDAGAELYRPLTTLSIATSYQLYGDSPLGYRIENLGLHGCASALLLALLLVWGFTQRTAILGAALFAVMPIHAEVLGSIILRNELIAACAGLLALIAHARGRWLGAGVATLCALLAKESAIALPILAWLADRARLTIPQTTSKAQLRGYAAIGLACGIALLFRMYVIGQLTLGDEQNLYFNQVDELAVWLTMARYAALHYFSATLFGAPLVFDFSPRSFETATSGDGLAWVLLIGWFVVVIAALLALFRSRSRIAFGFLFFLVALGPTANLVTRIGILGANRLAYCPSLGIALALAVAFEWFFRRTQDRHRVAWATAVLLLLGYTARTWQALSAYAHPFTLYSRIIAHAPQNALALGLRGLNSFAIALEQEPAPDNESQRTSAAWLAQSYEDLSASLRVDPSRWRAALPNLAYAAFQLQRPLELAPLFDSCLRRHEPELAQRLPTLSEDPHSLHLWSQALSEFAQRGSRERALAAIAHTLADYAEIAAFDSTSADAAAREQQMRRIEELGRLVQTFTQDGDAFVAAVFQSAVRPGLSAMMPRYLDALR